MCHRALSRFRPIKLAIATAALAILVTPVLGASFQGLGQLVDGRISRNATGISADGSVVSGTSSGLEAFRWTQASGSVGLGSIDELSISQAIGISADGEVVVGQGYSAGVPNAFRWTADSGMVALGDLPGGNPNNGSVAQAVSADGSVVVGQGTSAAGFEAFRWTESGGMVGLGDLPGGAFNSNAQSVSANGLVIVGQSQSAVNALEPFRWTEETGMVGLGDLGGESIGDAFGTSADGSVIVGFSGSEFGREAFRWTEAEGMVGLGDLPGSSFSSTAIATSADGSVVVGGGAPASGLEEAFLWTIDDGMRLLSELLTVDLGLDLTDWYLQRATGISADGMTIIGIGTNPEGVAEAWIATLPEPATGSLAALGGLVLLRRRRR